MARRRKWSGEERRELLAAHAQNGLSVWAFAAAAGVPHTTLVSWRRRVGGPPRFVPVEVEAGDEARPVDGGGSVRLVELVVRDVGVRVGAETDDALLARVVRILRSC